MAVASAATCSGRLVGDCDGECIWTNGQCQEICFKQGFACFEDMAGHRQTQVANADACQQRCQGITNCAYFTFYPHSGWCHVCDAQASQRTAVGGIRGTRDCTPATTPTTSATHSVVWTTFSSSTTAAAAAASHAVVWTTAAPAPAAVHFTMSTTGAVPTAARAVALVPTTAPTPAPAPTTPAPMPAPTTPAPAPIVPYHLLGTPAPAPYSNTANTAHAYGAESQPADVAEAYRLGAVNAAKSLYRQKWEAHGMAASPTSISRWEQGKEFVASFALCSTVTAVASIIVLRSRRGVSRVSLQEE